MTKDTWRPSASLEVMQKRGALLRMIRDFFSERGVLEVETPLLGRTGGTDPALEPIRARTRKAEELFLQTSPEFAMKRLLAAGSGPIYQLGKAFRDGEAGGRHNPEFTMLEWYRPGFDEHRLMNELTELIEQVLGGKSINKVTYRQLFQAHLALDPFTVGVEELRSLANARLSVSFDEEDRDFWLQLLYSHLIEPALGEPIYIHDFPGSQSALAALGVDSDGHTIARRFELVIGGLEIANGYFELTDPAEQRQRFIRDREIRHFQGIGECPLDEKLLGALESGLPSSAGVAVGVDRLLMLQLGIGSIKDVLAFPWS